MKKKNYIPRVLQEANQAEVLRLGWEILTKALKNKGAPNALKIKIALAVCSRAIKQDTESNKPDSRGLIMILPAGTKVSEVDGNQTIIVK